MLDFTPVRNKELSLYALAQRENLTTAKLHALTDEMVDRMLGLIVGSTDEDVTFVPDDPTANDTFAATSDVVNLPWTLGHVIVHTTASAEEGAFIGAELARGVRDRGGRSRYEVPWESVTTIQQCRDRLEESRRMRHAMIEVFPAKPHIENTYEPRPGVISNCMARFIGGLSHDDAHLGQIENIAAQAKAARTLAAATVA